MSIPAHCSLSLSLSLLSTLSGSPSACLTTTPQGSLNQLNQLGVNLGTLEPASIGCAHRVVEVEDDSELVKLGVEGGPEEGLSAGTEYSMAVRAWLNPGWSLWSPWAHVGSTSLTEGVPSGLRCTEAFECSLQAWPTHGQPLVVAVSRHPPPLSVSQRRSAY